jgi:hypothetical protein
MAKSPTVVAYSSQTANAPNTVRIWPTTSNYTVNSVVGNSKGISYLALATALTAGQYAEFNYTADTGW